VNKEQSASHDFLHFNIALAHPGDLPLRAFKVINLFFKLYSLRLSKGSPQKITPSQATKLSGLNRTQLTQALEDLVLHGVLKKIDAKRVEVLVKEEIKHSSALLEQEMKCFVPGVIYDKAGRFYCLNLNWQEWQADKDTSIKQLVEEYSLTSLDKVEEELDTDKSFATRALAYFCEKYRSVYGERYTVHGAPDMKGLKFILAKLTLSGRGRDLIFECIDRTFETMRSHSKVKARVLHVVQDFQADSLSRPVPPALGEEVSEFVTGLDGGVYKRGSEGEKRAAVL
jgi:hypothetical protein